MAKFMADVHMAKESEAIYDLAKRITQLHGLKELNDFELLYGDTPQKDGVWPAIGIRCFTPRAAIVIIAAYAAYC